jgi:hypothetical protein
MRTGLRIAIMAVAIGGATVSTAAAQAAPPAPAPAPTTPRITPAPSRAARPGEVQSAPIRCWWKTDRTAIRVGERFTLVLTCGVIETTGITVVPAVNQLEPGAISLTPFEAVSGVRRDDVVVPPWRYVQYEYSMRLLSEGFFGQDVNIPSLTVTYNLQSAGAGSEGRDQSYLLPPLPMRVESLVPRAATDIRDASSQTFADVEQRRFLSTLALVAAWIAFAFAAVMAGLAVSYAVGRLRTRNPLAVRPLPAPSLLAGCLRALGRARAEAAHAGWTPELRSRAMAALRIAAALALGRTVAQQFVDAGTPERPGQVAVRSGFVRRKRALVSAPTTPVAIAGRMQNGAVRGAQARVNVEQIADALKAFGAATYARGAEPDTLTLNSALDTAVGAIRRLRLSSLWPMRTAQAVARSITGF